MSGTGNLNQMAFVVPDLQDGIQFWTEVMGVGPFFVFPDLIAEDAEVRGERFIYKFGAAIAYSGELIIELIEPRGPSVFEDFLKAGRSGAHHTCRFVENLPAAQAELEAKGGKRIQWARFGPGSEVAYFDMSGDESVILELAQLAPEAVQLFDAIKAAGAAWDGATKTMKV